MEPIEIRARLLMKGKTMSQYAEMIGTTRQNIHSVISGRTKSKKYRQAIASFIDSDVADLWPENKKNTPAPADRQKLIAGDVGRAPDPSRS